jgi:hypothetical protein
MANDRNRENTRNSSQSGSGREDESKRMPGSQDRNPSGQSGSGSESSRSTNRGQSESGERGRSGSDSQSETGSSRRGSNPASGKQNDEEQPDQE